MAEQLIRNEPQGPLPTRNTTQTPTIQHNLRERRAAASACDRLRWNHAWNQANCRTKTR